MRLLRMRAPSGLQCASKINIEANRSERAVKADFRPEAESAPDLIVLVIEVLADQRAEIVALEQARDGAG